eukprot:TRINITY_DN18731_c0_g1_i1.p1 TRINITY_DN18731_c0_g1~~TRINITY_DN18731_c0_g1_i1.p1  ORF type:complete len:1900 (+),score=306.25 TRINITY_DN18731_c0_g1_i1:380-5701(+)
MAVECGWKFGFGNEPFFYEIEKKYRRSLRANGHPSSASSWQLFVDNYQDRENKFRNYMEHLYSRYKENYHIDELEKEFYVKFLVPFMFTLKITTAREAFNNKVELTEIIESWPPHQIEALPIFFQQMFPTHVFEKKKKEGPMLIITNSLFSRLESTDERYAPSLLKVYWLLVEHKLSSFDIIFAVKKLISKLSTCNLPFHPKLPPFGSPCKEGIKLLANARKTFKEQFYNGLMTPSKLKDQQSKFTESCLDVIRWFWKEVIIEYLGPPPCKLALISAGSASRGDMCPFSDVECILMSDIEYPKNHHQAKQKLDVRVSSYIDTFIYLFDFFVKSLGEDPGGFQKSGFHHDLKYYPDFVVTPEQAFRNLFEKRWNSTDFPSWFTHVYSFGFISGRYICGDESLWFQFQKLLECWLDTKWINCSCTPTTASFPHQNGPDYCPYLIRQDFRIKGDVPLTWRQAASFGRWWVRSVLAIGMEGYDVSNESTIISIKELMRPILNFLSSMQCYLRILEYHPIAILKVLRKEHANVIPYAYLLLLEHVLHFLYLLRIESHFTYGSAVDEVDLSGTSRKVLKLSGIHRENVLVCSKIISKIPFIYAGFKRNIENSDPFRNYNLVNIQDLMGEIYELQRNFIFSAQVSPQSLPSTPVDRLCTLLLDWPNREGATVYEAFRKQQFLESFSFLTNETVQQPPIKLTIIYKSTSIVRYLSFGIFSILSKPHPVYLRDNYGDIHIREIVVISSSGDFTPEYLNLGPSVFVPLRQLGSIFLMKIVPEFSIETEMILSFASSVIGKGLRPYSCGYWETISKSYKFILFQGLSDVGQESLYSVEHLNPFRNFSNFTLNPLIKQKHVEIEPICAISKEERYNLPSPEDTVIDSPPKRPFFIRFTISDPTDIPPKSPEIRKPPTPLLSQGAEVMCYSKLSETYDFFGDDLEKAFKKSTLDVDQYSFGRMLVLVMLTWRNPYTPNRTYYNYFTKEIDIIDLCTKEEDSVIPVLCMDGVNQPVYHLLADRIRMIEIEGFRIAWRNQFQKTLMVLAEKLKEDVMKIDEVLLNELVDRLKFIQDSLNSTPDITYAQLFTAIKNSIFSRYLTFGKTKLYERVKYLRKKHNTSETLQGKDAFRERQNSSSKVLQQLNYLYEWQVEASEEFKPQNLKFLTNLQSLQIHTTSENLSLRVSLPSLTNLNISHINTKGLSLSFSDSSFPNLKIVKLNFANIKSWNIKHTLYNLNELHLVSVDLNLALFTTIRTFPHLRKLVLTNSETIAFPPEDKTKKESNPCFPSLTNLNFSCSNKLKILKISAPLLSKIDLSHCINLEEVVLDSGKLRHINLNYCYSLKAEKFQLNNIDTKFQYYSAYLCDLAVVSKLNALSDKIILGDLSIEDNIILETNNISNQIIQVAARNRPVTFLVVGSMDSEKEDLIKVFTGIEEDHSLEEILYQPFQKYDRLDTPKEPKKKGYWIDSLFNSDRPHPGSENALKAHRLKTVNDSPTSLTPSNSTLEKKYKKYCTKSYSATGENSSLTFLDTGSLLNDVSHLKLRKLWKEIEIQRYHIDGIMFLHKFDKISPTTLQNLKIIVDFLQEQAPQIPWKDKLMCILTSAKDKIKAILDHDDIAIWKNTPLSCEELLKRTFNKAIPVVPVAFKDACLTLPDKSNWRQNLFSEILSLVPDKVPEIFDVLEKNIKQLSYMPALNQRKGIWLSQLLQLQHNISIPFNTVIFPSHPNTRERSNDYPPIFLKEDAHNNTTQQVTFLGTCHVIQSYAIICTEQHIFIKKIINKNST